MDFHFFAPKKTIQDYEVVDTATQDLMKYNIELLQSIISDQKNELSRLREDNERLREEIRRLEKPEVKSESSHKTKFTPRIMSPSDLINKLEFLTRRKKVS